MLLCNVLSLTLNLIRKNTKTIDKKKNSWDDIENDNRSPTLDEGDMDWFDNNNCHKILV